MSDKLILNNDENNDEAENDQPSGRSLGLDLGDDTVYNVEPNRLESQPQSDTNISQENSCSNTRREDNPFSFRHFLRDVSNTSSRNYQSLGARPKNSRSNQNRRHVAMPPESPQRHEEEIIKQFPSVLPDFVQDHLVIEQCFLGKNKGNPDFDGSTEYGGFDGRPHHQDEQASIPLDLPGLSFPLDLPLTNESKTTPLAEVGNSRSLPDFLTDAPVPSSCLSSGNANPACRNCSAKEAEVENLRHKLHRSEQNVSRYKAQVKQLQAEIRALQEAEGGAVGGGDGRAAPFDAQATQQLAQDLRVAASTAEYSLKSLLNGVENLRVMAVTLENLQYVGEKSANNLFSPIDDDHSGPAL